MKSKTKKIFLILALFVNFFNTTAQTAYCNPETKLFGVINRSGKIIVKPTYSNMTAFQYGISRFEENGKWGIMDTSGRKILPAKFEMCAFNRLGFNEGLISVSLDSKFGFYNYAGKLVIPHIYDLTTDFCSGIAWVEKDEKYNFIDLNGEYISERWFDDVKIVDGVNYGIVAGFDETYYRIESSGIALAKDQDFLRNYGTYYISYCDNRVSNSLETELTAHYDKVSNLYGYKNFENNNVIISPQFLRVTYFSEGFALALMINKEKTDTNLVIINEKGAIEAIMDRKFSRYWNDWNPEPEGFNDGLITLDFNEILEDKSVKSTSYLINTKGKIIIEGWEAYEISFGESGDC
jgi:hypothetical protein